VSARRAWRAVLLLAGILALGGPGCQSTVAASDKDLLEIVDRFHHDIRWKYNQQAAARVPSHQAADFLEQLEGMKDDLNITAWDVRKVEVLPDPDPEKKRVAVRMHLEYYLMPSTVLREVSVEQVWEQVDSAWMCMSLKNGPIEFQASPPPGADGGTDGGVPRPEDEPSGPAKEGAPRRVEDLPDEGPEGG
jgi:hypothetical protein